MFKFGTRGNSKTINMYDLIPRALVKSETSREGRIILLKPKFNNAFMVKHLMPRLKRPFYRIHLDQLGTSTWQKIDGERSAGIIAEEVSQELGTAVEPVFKRVGLFLHQLKKGDLIEF
jgi:hypothetical protein